MRRELKFRAWQESQNKMHQEIGLHPHIMTNHTMCDVDECGYVAEGTGKGEYTLYTDYDSWPIMQFTGLKDKNGIEIYEGDIIQMEYITAKIYWHNGSFHIGLDESQGSNVFNQERANRFEVIGNIHQNPELL